MPALVQLLSSSPSDDVRGHAAWALGNIAGDSDLACRDHVLAAGALAPLLGLLREAHEVGRLSMLRDAAWVLPNFCGGTPRPCFDTVRPALPVLARLARSTDEEVLASACWALSYLADSTSDNIADVVDAGVCKRLVELLAHPSQSVLIPALQTVGNIVTSGVQIQTVIECAALPRLLQLLTGDHSNTVKKEACWAVSNITAGNTDHIQAVIDAGIVPALVSLLGTSEFNIKKRAAWALSNATAGGTNPQIRYLVTQGCIKPMCDLLACSDARVITVVLEGLQNILKVGACDTHEQGVGAINAYAALVDEAEGLEKMKILRMHPSDGICEKARD